VRAVARCLGEYRELWPTWLPLLALAALTPVAGMAVPLVERRLIDDVLLAKRLDLLPTTAGMYGALVLLTSISHYAGGYLRSYLDASSPIRRRSRSRSPVGTTAARRWLFSPTTCRHSPRSSAPRR
jgi:hypothetical protein